MEGIKLLGSLFEGLAMLLNRKNSSKTFKTPKKGN